jgi:hypothetical protein
MAPGTLLSDLHQHSCRQPVVGVCFRSLLGIGVLHPFTIIPILPVQDIPVILQMLRASAFEGKLPCCEDTHWVVADRIATVLLIGHPGVGRGGTIDREPYVKLLMKFSVTRW